MIRNWTLEQMMNFLSSHLLLLYGFGGGGDRSSSLLSLGVLYFVLYSRDTVHSKASTVVLRSLSSMRKSNEND